MDKEQLIQKQSEQVRLFSSLLFAQNKKNIAKSVEKYSV
jgi:hypothetical protein